MENSPADLLREAKIPKLFRNNKAQKIADEVFLVCRAALSKETIKKELYGYNQRVIKENKLRKKRHQPLLKFLSRDEVIRTCCELDVQISMKWVALKQLDPVEYAKEWVSLSDEAKMAIYTIVSADEVVING